MSRPIPQRPSTRRTRAAGRGALLIVGSGVLLLAVLGAVLAVVLGSEDGADGATAAEVPAFGEVTVAGSPLPQLGEGADPAIGAPAPVVRGVSPAGESVEVGPGEPTLVVFLAHWCPHCQAELPRLVDLAAGGGFEGIRAVAVLTGTNPNAPNFPPVSWLTREGWPGDVLLDSTDFAAAAAFGLGGYPYLVVLDTDGAVVGRGSGEMPMDEVAGMIAAAQG